MSVATFKQPDFTAQDASTYKTALDGGFSVLARSGQAFAPHAAAAPNMTVVVDAGFVFDGLTTTNQTQQVVGPVSAPVASPRIDLVVCDIYSGVATIVTGVEASSPAVPAVPSGKFPVAQIALTAGASAITNSMITDVRAIAAPPSRASGGGTISSGYSTQQTDLGKALKLNGAFVVALMSSVGAGWWAMLKNVGSGVITLVPQSGMIDGLGSLPLQSGQGIVLSFDGANFYTYGLGGAGNPTGTIINSACSAAPTGYLLCDGSTVSRSVYAALFLAIGTTYGAGDGNTTFNLPDGRGVALRGLDNGRGIDSGRALGSYQADAIASHGVTVSDPGHSHNAIQAYVPLAADGSGTNTRTKDAPAVAGSSAATSPSGGHPTTISLTTYTGELFGTNAATSRVSAAYSGAGETRMKNLAVNFFIKY